MWFHHMSRKSYIQASALLQHQSQRYYCHHVTFNIVRQEARGRRWAGDEEEHKEKRDGVLYVSNCAFSQKNRLLSTLGLCFE